MIFSSYEPNAKASIAFLKLLGVKVNNATVAETLQSHPNWPSLLCISDSFNKWHIPNAAGKIDTKDIDQLPTPFIAYTNDREYPIVIVTETSDKNIQFYTNGYRKPVVKSRGDFLNNWTGIYLLAEPTEQSGEKDYVVNKRRAHIRSLVPVSLLILLTFLSFILLHRVISNYVGSVMNIAGIYLQYGIILSGIVVTSLLLWYEIDRNNPVLKKVCTGILKGNCNAILTSRQAKVFSWLSWSEVGFFYFAGALMVLLLADADVALPLLAWLNIIALPYTVFSIYYQWRVARQWCVLCLAVQALLVLGAVNVIVHNFGGRLPSFIFIIQAFLFYILPVVLWHVLKPYILRLQEAKNTKSEYQRIKFNNEIFEVLIKKQKQVDYPAEGMGIVLGNPHASYELIKVCSPYCSPCSKAHPKIDRLLEELPNLKVKIIFTTPNQPEHRAFKITNHLLAIAEQNKDEKIIKQALDDWYLPDNKNYEAFAEKYQMNNDESLKHRSTLDIMHKWCNEMDIHFTPSIFISPASTTGGKQGSRIYQLHDAYNIEDLQYFLLGYPLCEM